jgi:hypothetical protein
MMGSAKVHYDGIVAISLTRFHRSHEEDFPAGAGEARR